MFSAGRLPVRPHQPAIGSDRPGTLGIGHGSAAFVFRPQAVSRRETPGQNRGRVQNQPVHDRLSRSNSLTVISPSDNPSRLPKVARRRPERLRTHRVLRPASGKASAGGARREPTDKAKGLLAFRARRAASFTLAPLPNFSKHAVRRQLCPDPLDLRSGSFGLPSSRKIRDIVERQVQVHQVADTNVMQILLIEGVILTATNELPVIIFIVCDKQHRPFPSGIHGRNKKRPAYHL